MSEQTVAGRDRWPAMVTWGIVAVLTVIGLPSLVSRAPELVRRAVAAQPHGLDLALFAAQPLLLQLHILAVALAAPLGAAMMLSRKGARFHRLAGWTWVGLVGFGAITPVWLALTDGRWFPIHLTSVFVLVLLTTGVAAARRHDRDRHRSRMRVLFYGSILGAGAFTLLPGRLIWRLFFG